VNVLNQETPVADNQYSFLASPTRTLFSSQSENALYIYQKQRAQTRAEA
jgi:hypothetical protein